MCWIYFSGKIYAVKAKLVFEFNMLLHDDQTNVIITLFNIKLPG